MKGSYDAWETEDGVEEVVDKTEENVEKVSFDTSRVDFRDDYIYEF